MSSVPLAWMVLVGAGSPAVLLALLGGASLVNRPSRIVVGEVFVRPGDPANSWMIIAISDDAARRRGLARMPLASGALTQNQIRTIMNWITRGAPDD